MTYAATHPHRLALIEGTLADRLLTTGGVQKRASGIRTLAVSDGMDQNKQRLQPGFLSAAAFSSGFPGLATGTTSNVSFMSTLQQLSGLSAPMLSGAALPTDLTQWAAQQQGWMDQQATVAAMLPTMYGMFNVAKGLDLNSAEMLSTKAAAAAAAVVSAQVATATTSSASATSIFPNHSIALSSLPTTLKSEHIESACVDSPAGPSSANPSSNQSVSTPHEIDVGGISQPNSQSQPYDLSLKETQETPQPSTSQSEDTVPPLIVKPVAVSTLESSISKKACVPTVAASIAGHIQNGTTTPHVETEHIDNVAVEENWANIDISDFDLFAGASAKEKEAVMTSAFEFDMMKNVFDIDTEGAPKRIKVSPINSFSAASLATSSNTNIELADADKELERLLNTFEEKNKKQPAPFPFNLLPGTGEENPSLSPVQFTPPDSPSGGAHDALRDLFSTAPEPETRHAESSFPGPSTSKSSMPKIEPKLFLKKEPVYKKESSIFRQKSSKMPVYKQKTSTIYVDNDDKLKVTCKDDAYSFTDEDDDLTSIAEPKDKLSEEVQQKLAKIANQTDLGKKNVYVPGVGFAVPKEDQADLWRHVVPKKRFGAMGDGPRPIIPSTTLLPPAAAAALCQPDIVTLAESIRRRKKDRIRRQDYCRAEMDKNKECAKEEGVIMIHDRVAEPGDHPPLPKLLIRIPRRVLEEHNEREERKRRKRKKKDKDREWEGSDRAKRKKKHKRSRRHSDQYESQLIEREEEDEYLAPLTKTLPPPVTQLEEPPSDLSMLSKKRRLMMQWQDAENEKTAQAQAAAATSAVSETVANGTRYREKVTVPARAYRSEFNSELVRKRLSRFGPADGQLPKGTFVVCKADLFKEDCALWRVDNQNLLQKYPPRMDPETKKISYRNSSTYSGWCDQIASGYLTVKIRYLKQTRSEAVIEPEVPLADLFPAISTELVETSDNCVMPGLVSINEKTETNFNFLLKDPSRLNLFTFITAMLRHVLTLDFFQEIKEKNDWNYLSAMTEIEKNNSECLEKMRQRVKWPEKYEDTLQRYIQCALTESEFGSVTCQSCGARPVEKTVQLYGMELYDRDTLQPSDDLVQPGCESPLPATELLVCSNCAIVSQLFHQIVHMKYNLLKKCEDKLEVIGSEYPDAPPEKIVEKAKDSASWITKIVGEYADLWKKVQVNDF